MEATVQEASTPYARRDSATTALRKLGIDKADYHRFIDVLKDEDGTLFVVDTDAAKAHLKRRKTDKPAQTEAAKVAAVARVAPVKKHAPTPVAKRVAAKKGAQAAANKRTVSAVARGLIADGKSNDEVWKLIKAEFKLDDAKKGYPAWYRAEMKRKGLLKG